MDPHHDKGCVYSSAARALVPQVEVKAGTEPDGNNHYMLAGMSLGLGRGVTGKLTIVFSINWWVWILQL